MQLKYSKAPISELTFGVFFKTNILSRNIIMFDAILRLNKEYPILQTLPPIPFEEFQNGNIAIIQDINTTGFSSYWLNSPDFIYRIDLNFNSIQFTWQRNDDMPTISRYPGFRDVYLKFKEIFKTISEISASHGHALSKDIRLLGLKYVDRMNLKVYKDLGISLGDIIKISYPKISLDGNDFFSDNYVSKYSINIPSLNGYSIVNINTPTYPDGQKLLIDNKVKGLNDDLDVWFEQAHQTQLSFFENIFTDRILNDWK